MNYKEIGKNPYIEPKYRKGVSLVNDFVNSLHKQGLLPKQFSISHRKDSLKTEVPAVSAIMNPDQFEESWQKEIADLSGYIEAVKEGVSSKNENTLKGFGNFLASLSKEASKMGRNPNLSIDEVLQVFEESNEAYKNSTKRPLDRRQSGKVIRYPNEGILTPRYMRILIFNYGLLPNQQPKSLKDLAKEEEFKTVRDNMGRAKIHMVWHLCPRIKNA